MPRTSIEKRRKVRALEAARDKQMEQNKKGKSRIAAIRAELKTVRTQ